MTEDQIRSDIKARLPTFFCDRRARVIEELEICAGKARADMAVITDRLIGIEIKGPKDRLTRLKCQADYYSKCFDEVVLVVHERLAREATGLVPQWWGIVVSQERDGDHFYKMKRRPTQNQHVDVNAVLGLLWRIELEALFAEHLQIEAPASSSKRKLRQQLLEVICPSILKVAGILLLREREDWRSVQIS